MHQALYDMTFLSYITSRYAQEVRCTTQNVPFFRPAHLGKGTRWRVPVASPRLVVQLRHRAFLHQPTVAPVSRDRVVAPDTRQSEERSCSPDTPIDQGRILSPSGHPLTRVVPAPCDPASTRANGFADPSTTFSRCHHAKVA
jgi:hypothetical protein